MDKTVLIEQTSKRLKRWELIVTAMVFLTLFAGFGLSLCSNLGSGGGVVAFRGVSACIYRRADCHLVVARITMFYYEVFI